MKTLMIKKTEYTPEIELNATKQIISVKGDSFPENTYDFYKPVMNWMEEYFTLSHETLTTVNMEINYFNSSSSQLFFDFFDVIEAAAKDGQTIEVNWIYTPKNESAFEAGQDFSEEFESIKINMVEK